MRWLQHKGDGTLVQSSERFVNTANTLMSGGAAVGLCAGMMLGIGLFAALGKGVLGGARVPRAPTRKPRSCWHERGS